MKTKTMLAAAAMVLAALSPAMADADGGDELYQCDDGSTLEFVEITNEMRITGKDGSFHAVVPWLGSMSRFAYWSPSADINDIGEHIPPYVMYWQPAKGDAQVYYDLGDGKVYCRQQSQ